MQRGFDSEKIKSEFERLASLKPAIIITNILLPINHLFEDDINRFYKHGYRKKINQNLISKFVQLTRMFTQQLLAR